MVCVNVSFRFPQATIVSVEASSRNFQMLRLNTQQHPNIIPVNVALWPRTVPLSLVVGPRNPDMPPEWGYMVKETSEVRLSRPPMQGSLWAVSLCTVVIYPLFGLFSDCHGLSAQWTLSRDPCAWP